MGYFVSRRTQEIGVRMALGANTRGRRRLVVRQAVVPLAIGLAIGLAASLAATRLLTNQLFGVAPADPVYVRRGRPSRWRWWRCWRR